MKNNLSIKSIFLENVQTNPKEFFYLAPDVVGSINNARSSKDKKTFIIDFNTTDAHKMKLIVPHDNYSKYHQSQNSNNNSEIAKSFLMMFVGDAEPIETGGDETLDEMVDEFGNLYGEKDDMPANIKGNPGQDQQKDSDSMYQNTNQRTIGMNSGSAGFGAVVW